MRFWDRVRWIIVARTRGPNNPYLVSCSKVLRSELCSLSLICLNFEIMEVATWNLGYWIQALMMLAIINWYSVNMSPQKYSRRSVWWLLSPSPPKRHWQLLLNLVSATNIISTWMILYTIFNPSPEKEIWNWFPNDVIKRWLCIENFRKFQNYFSCSSLLVSQSPHLSARNSSIIREPHHHHSPMRRCICSTARYNLHNS